MPGHDRTQAYRVVITADPPAEDAAHVSGGVPADGPSACPNCARPLFPVFKLSTADARVGEAVAWSRDVLEVVFCPACALYMEPYWACYGPGPVEVRGGERDGGDVLQEIETPYEERVVRLVPLEQEDGPAAEDPRGAPGTGELGPRVRHQLGGPPPDRPPRTMSCCKCGAPMRFAGIVDYDDENVPLFEPGRRPVALIIGDRDRLHWYTCEACSVVGAHWSR